MGNMKNIEKLKEEIVERLKPLDPDKIILFGSYAYGEPDEDSDIDLFLLKDDLILSESRKYERAARKNIRDLIFKYQIGFDILSASTEEVNKREDYFFKVDIKQNGRVLYERASS